jgi:hypothetical protein
MTTIPLFEALMLLDRAHDVIVTDTPCTMTSCVVNAADPVFLELRADDGDGREFKWVFDRAANQEVNIDGSQMTLLAEGDDFNEPGPVEMRLLVPLALEPSETPPLVLRALRHVRAHFPEVDRVVFWGDGKWTFLRHDHHNQKFDKLIDISLLEDAADSVADGYPHAFQLNPEHL